MKSGKQILTNFFDSFDVEYVFGNPGTTETTFLDVVANHDKVKFILALHESVATGIAAGYALSSKKTAIVNIHTYPGLANAMSNMYNAYKSGIPMLVVAGQQNRQHLIHKPNLSGDLTALASTATSYQYEIRDVSEMNVALQRCYLEATECKVPTFLSIPMEIYEDSCEDGSIKKTQILDNTVVTDISPIVNELLASKKLAIVADGEALWGDNIKHTIIDIVNRLDCDVYIPPFSVYSVVDPKTPNYKGVLPGVTSEINNTLAQYDTILLLGETITAFLYHEKSALPTSSKLIQLSSGNTTVRYNFPCDYTVRGNIARNLEKISDAIKDMPIIATDNQYQRKLNKTLLVDMLSTLPKDLPVVVEGSSHSSVEDIIVNALQFENVYYEPRGGALGWAMPIAVGVALNEHKHSICMMGDGGSMYSIHAIWTAAHYKIPTIFICFVNHEYHILKDLWKLQVPTSTEEDYKTIMDIKDPELDLHKIAAGFGARVASATAENYQEILAEALQFQGPTFITIPDDHKYSI